MELLRPTIISFILLFTLFIKAEESFIPDPPSLNASNFILIDAATNRILAEKDSESSQKLKSIIENLESDLSRNERAALAFTIIDNLRENREK